MIGQIDNLDDCFVDLWCSGRCNNGECICNYYGNWFRNYMLSSRKEKKFYLHIYLIVTNSTYLFLSVFAVLILQY